jgi:hypothetical protein
LYSAGLRLRRNLVHQRTIAIGLAHIGEYEARDVVVMDSDGEDDPRDVPRLVARMQEERGRSVFAERTRRSESCCDPEIFRPNGNSQRVAVLRKLAREPADCGSLQYAGILAFFKRVADHCSVAG